MEGVLEYVSNASGRPATTVRIWLYYRKHGYATMAMRPSAGCRLGAVQLHHGVFAFSSIPTTRSVTLWYIKGARSRYQGFSSIPLRGAS